VESQKTSNVEHKVSALMAYRKAKGLCYKCGMKWQPRHKCAAIVSLNMVEELWQLVQNGGKENSQLTVDEESDSGDDLMALSIHAVQGTDSPKTVRMMGRFHATEVVMLVDSSSTHSFISESLAAQWSQW